MGRLSFSDGSLIGSSVVGSICVASSEAEFLRLFSSF